LVVGSVGGNDGRGSRRLHRFRFRREGVPVVGETRAATRVGLRRGDPGKHSLFRPTCMGVVGEPREGRCLAPRHEAERNRPARDRDSVARMKSVEPVQAGSWLGRSAWEEAKRTLRRATDEEVNAAPSRMGREPWGGDRSGRERRKAPAARISREREARGARVGRKAGPGVTPRRGTP